MELDQDFARQMIDQNTTVKNNSLIIPREKNFNGDL